MGRQAAQCNAHCSTTTHVSNNCTTIVPFTQSRVPEAMVSAPLPLQELPQPCAHPAAPPATGSARSCAPAAAGRGPGPLGLHQPLGAQRPARPAPCQTPAPSSAGRGSAGGRSPRAANSAGAGQRPVILEQQSCQEHSGGFWALLMHFDIRHAWCKTGTTGCIRRCRPGRGQYDFARLPWKAVSTLHMP